MSRFALLLALAGCAAIPATKDPLPLRNPTAPIASQADVTLHRLSGTWIVVQGAGLPPGTPLRFARTQAQVAGRPVTLTAGRQGRFTLDGEEIWVFWLDADNRTAALGDPHGRRVWIMDRTGQPAERLRAAREILDWYGYDLTRLEAP